MVIQGRFPKGTVEVKSPQTHGLMQPAFWIVLQGVAMQTLSFSISPRVAASDPALWL